MASSTYKSFLMHKSDTNYAKLLDIKSYPDLGGDPEQIESTTLSDYMQTFVEGVQSSDALSFTANYTPDDYKAVAALEGKDESYAVWFGATGGGNSGTALVPDGSLGKFEFKGSISVHVNSGDVNAVREMTVTITPSTAITPNFD